MGQNTSRIKCCARVLHAGLHTHTHNVAYIELDAVCPLCYFRLKRLVPYRADSRMWQFPLFKREKTNHLCVHLNRIYFCNNKNQQERNEYQVRTATRI